MAGLTGDAAAHILVAVTKGYTIQTPGTGRKEAYYDTENQ
jgi:hypothetical protein